MTPIISTTERSKRIREGVVIAVAILLILALTRAEMKLTQLSVDAPLGSNLAIFGVINIVILLVILLVYLVSRNLVKLFMESRSNPFTTRLRTKLVISFVGLSLIPTMLLFFAAAGFINNTVHNWFNTQVETSLRESLEVAQTYYKTSASNALYYGHQIGGFIKADKLLNQDNLPKLRELIKTKQKEYNLGVVEVYSAQYEELVQVANPLLPKGEFTTPDTSDIKRVLAGEELTRINQVGKADLIRGMVPVYSTWNAADIVGVVVVNYYVPYSLANKMKEITESYHEFRQLKILKNPIRAGYIITLFLIAVVIAFFAYWMGVYLANSMTKPLHELVEATQAVVGGDLGIQIESFARDEIGQLVHSFNRMTGDLKLKQEALNRSNFELSKKNQEIEERRRYMEIVLRNVAAGVISINREGVITTVNTSAEKLLAIPNGTIIGRTYRDVLNGEHLEAVAESLKELVESQQETINRQLTVERGGGKRALHLHISMLHDETGEFMGVVLVLDDLTQLLKAQRMVAWREVARRIAHEIKNPLTPIQLSAQRLRKRYLDRFSGDETVFDQCTSMIIKSVDEMKNLVNEFSNFARMPAVHPIPADLNELVGESLTLYKEGHRSVRFLFTPDMALPHLLLDREQIKRVLINLLENSVAALSEVGDIEIYTKYDLELNMASLVVADHGPGIPDEDKQRLFEPYFSTKKTGTGLGLAIVSSIITDHNGFVRVRDTIPHGATFVVELPVK